MVASRIHLGVAAVLAVTACSGQEWTGTVYPDGSNLSRSETLGTFSSLEACRSACVDELERLGASGRGDYECGLNCRPHDHFDVLICDHTRS